MEQESKTNTHWYAGIVGFFAVVGIPLIAIGEWVQPLSSVAGINANILIKYFHINPLGNNWRCVTCSKVDGHGFELVGGVLKADFADDKPLHDATYYPDEQIIRVDGLTAYVSADKRTILWMDGNKLGNKWTKK